MEDIRKQKRGPRVTRKYQTARNFAFNLGAKGTNARLDTRPASAGGCLGNPLPTWEQDMIVEFEPYLSWDGSESAPKPQGRGVEIIDIRGNVNVRTRSGPTQLGTTVPRAWAQAGWLFSIHGRPPDIDSEGRNNFSDQAMVYVQGDVGFKIPSQTVAIPQGSWGFSKDGIIRVKAAVFMNEDERMALHIEASLVMDWRYST